MAEGATHPGSVTSADQTPRLRHVWQGPLLVVSALVLGGAIVAAVVTAPQPDVSVGLEGAAKMVEAGRYGEALEALNREILPHLAKNQLSAAQRGQFHLLRARALSLGQREAGLDRRENHENILAEYTRAERLEAALTDDDRYYLASTLVSLQEYDRALKLTERLPEAAHERRVELLRAMTDRCLAATPPDLVRALDLVTLVTADPRLAIDDRVWALNRQGEILIGTGYAGDAITKIIRTLPKLDQASGPQLGELYVTLARAYMADAAASATPEQAGESFREAKARLARAGAWLPADHAQRWLVTLLQAEIEHHQGELDKARRGYAEVVDRYSFAPEMPTALLGLAEVEAQIGMRESDGASERSLDRYGELVEMFRSGAPSGGLTPERVGESLISRFREQYERGKFPEALRYASLAERLYGPDQAPAELTLGLAEVHKRLAESALRSAGGAGLMDLADADAATQREARDHLLRAGGYYDAHAAKVVLVSAAEHAQSLWDAADAFDRGGDLESSSAAFRQFLSDFPGDPRRAEAMFRLAQACRAGGALDEAAGLYQQLIDERGAIDGSGRFADQSFVPLAQTLFADADPANDARAEALLTQVVSGEVTGPTTRVFRDALRELGDQLHRTGRYPQAIERFEQYLASSAGSPGTGGDESPVVYRLAEAYRLSAAEIARTLASGMPDGTKRDLEQERIRRLRRAGDLYQRVKDDLERRPRRTALEDTLVRNAYFFQGDCAFDLREYDTAIRLYDAARERYAKDPAALVAMTQIVSALLAQGETAKAQVAQKRARRFFNSLPEAVWDDPNLPMKRQDWERWLSAQEALDTPTAGPPRAGAGGSE